MKRLSYLGLAALVLGAMACTKDPIAKPLAKVTAQDGAAEAVAKIDDVAKSIKFDKLANVEDFAAVKVDFVAAEGASIVSPGISAVVDFTKQPVTVVVNDGVNDVNYNMTAGAPDPIKSVKVGDKVGKINGTDISLEYDKETMFADNIAVTLELRKGAVVKEPSELVFDFVAKTTHKLVVSYLGKDHAYAVRLAGFEPEENLFEKEGWTKAEEEYGNLPKHINVYTNKKLLGTGNFGVMVELDKRATLTVFGDGKSAASGGKQIALRDCYKENTDQIIMFSGLNGLNQAIVKDGKLVYSSSSIYPVVAQEEDGKFFITPQKRGADGKSLERYSKDGTKLVAEKWLPKQAFGGYYMVAIDGKQIETYEEMDKTGDKPNPGWFDNLYARELAGVTKDGKLIMFVCDQVRDKGVDMRKAIEMMLKVGCVDVMTMEGSGSPDLLINGNNTVYNSKIFKADGTVIENFLKAKKYSVIPAFK